MWQPQYGTAVYADVDCSKLSSAAYEITATFYTTKEKNKVLGVVSGVFKKSGDHFILSSMQTGL
jgi:hypothetical protein